MRNLILCVLWLFSLHGNAAKSPNISADDILTRIAKGKPVSLSGVTIEGDLDFTRLPSYKTGPANSEVAVNVPLYFEKCRFKGKIIASKERGEAFINTLFRFNISLVNCVFYQKLNLKSARIDGVFSLAGSEINGTVNAQNLWAGSDAFFGSTLFAREVYFQNARFQGRAGFSKAVFNEVVYFQNCRFAEETLFRECVFEKPADFSLGKFEGVLSFDYSVIKGKLFLQSGLFFNSIQLTDARFIEINLENSVFLNQHQEKLKSSPGILLGRVKFL